MSDEEIQVLQNQLWAIANTVRDKHDMDMNELQVYILSFIFYKFLSEKMQTYGDSLLAANSIKYLDLKDAELQDIIKKDAAENNGFYIASEELFSNIVKKSKNNNIIIPDLHKAFSSIENSTTTDSKEDFGGLFSYADLSNGKLGKDPEARNAVIVEILTSLNKIDFRIEDKQTDVLGDAYEYLISNFAAGAGKKAGEFYTPQQISKVLAKIVTNGKQVIKSVYDPTCGSGSLLLAIEKEAKVNDYYGQEKLSTTYNLARMNMIMRGVNYANFNIQQGNTLENPCEEFLNLRFDAVVANPPFSSAWEANNLKLVDDRFSQYGKLAPKSKADYAFVQHMIYQLADNGTMAVVLPHGVLFRGGSERHIRKYLIGNKNYLDCVIGLPKNIFYSTSIPTCIMVFKKCRTSDKILFIDASREFEKRKNQNHLTDENINKIITTFEKRAEIDKYSHNASLKEIAENDYNLNIPRYVDSFEEEEIIDLEQTTKAIKALDLEMQKTDKEIADFCNELGIDSPFEV